MKYRKNIRFFCVSIVFLLSTASVCSLYFYNRHYGSDQVQEYQKEQLNLINFAFNDHVLNCESNVDKTQRIYKDLLKEQAFALNANLNNILTEQQEQNRHSAAEQSNTDTANLTDETKTIETPVENKDPIQDDAALLRKLSRFQKNLNTIGYDFLIAKGSQIIFEPLDKSLIKANTTHLDNDNNQLKDLYILKTDSKKFLSFVFTNSSQYNFVFIKDVTNLEDNLVADRKHTTFLNNLFKEVNTNSAFDLVIFDEKAKKVIASSNRSKENAIDSNIYKAILDNTLAQNPVTIEGKHYTVSYKKLDKRDYYVLSLCDVSYISSLSFNYLYFAIPPFLAFITFIFAPLLSGSISKEINALIEKFNSHLNSVKENTQSFADGSLDKDIDDAFKQTVSIIRAMLANLDARINNELQDHIQKNTSGNKAEFIKAIQKNNLPTEKTMPSSKYMEISSYLLNGAQNSGNFYNTLRLDDDNLAFIIGNIDSSDIYTKSYMMTLVNSMSVALLNNGMLPNRVLYALNNEIITKETKDLEISLLITILNEKTGNYIASNAGHLHPLIISDNEVTDATQTIDPVIGGIKDVEYTEQKGKLNYGQSMLFFSEGLVDQKNKDGDVYGRQRLSTITQSTFKQDPGQIIYDTLMDLMKFAEGGKAISDITMLSIQRKNIE